MIRAIGVTGASGFLGKHLVEGLLSQNHRVCLFVRDAQKIGSLVTNDKVDIIEGDLSNLPKIKEFAKKCHSIVHCAGHVSDWGEKELFVQANVIGTKNLAAAAITHKVTRFVHISTTDVYGYSNEVSDEDTPFHKKGVNYADSKVDAELVIQSAINQGLNATILRPGNVYGPGSHTLVVELIEGMKLGLFPTVHSREGLTALIYVSNLVDVIMSCLDRTDLKGQAFNIHDDLSINWKDYFSALAEISGKKVIFIPMPFSLLLNVAKLCEWFGTKIGIKQRPGLTKMAVYLFGTNHYYSIERAKNVLGYSPGVNFDQSIKETSDWYNGL